MTAWWSGTAADACAADPALIVNHLARRLVETHMVNHEAQIRVWRDQIVLLQSALLPFADWHVLLEYPLVRLGRRIDAVILTDRAILVLEFKTEATAFTTADRRQVEDYALDLFDFHAASRIHPIVPILVAARAPHSDVPRPLFWHAIAPVIDANAAMLGTILHTLATDIPAASARIDPHAWERAPYRPVPTIVEAATMLYRKHGVADIAAARADVINLARTADAIRAAIAEAAASHRHVIVFVTGIPGAGKTLCGLNAVFTASHEAAFLTGNLPLVHVLRAALARDAQAQGKTLRDAAHKIESAIQPLLGFLRDNQPRDTPPHEHVMVFDEAQRAWDAEFGQRKCGLPDSEAALFLDPGAAGALRLVGRPGVVSGPRPAVVHAVSRHRGGGDGVGRVFIRTIGIARATTWIGLANLVCNMHRLAWLDRKTAPAWRKQAARSKFPGQKTPKSDEIEIKSRDREPRTAETVLKSPSFEVPSRRGL